MFNKSLLIAIVFVIIFTTAFYFYLSGSGSILMDAADLPLLALMVFVITFVSALFGGRKFSFPSQAGTRSPKSDNRATYDVPREAGNVKWFNASKGFGFITRDSGDDVFVHFRSIRGDGHRVLYDGQRVDFVVSQGDKGLQAEDVAVAG
jgi:cold shock protein